MLASELKNKISLNILMEADLVEIHFVGVGLMEGHLLYHATNRLPESFTCYINKGSLVMELIQRQRSGFYACLC